MKKSFTFVAVGKKNIGNDFYSYKFCHYDKMRFLNKKIKKEKKKHNSLGKSYSPKKIVYY